MTKWLENAKHIQWKILTKIIKVNVEPYTSQGSTF